MSTWRSRPIVYCTYVMEALSNNPESAELGASLTVEAERPLPGLRAWFVVLLLWLGGLAGLALVMFGRYEQGDPYAMRVWMLALVCFYLSICNTFLPLPTAWIILFAVSPEVGLFDSGVLSVVTVAGLGALATVFANLTEYHVLAFLFRYGLGQRIRQTRVYQWSLRWFDIAPFQTLALFGFVPIPIDAVRWLAILRHYSRVRFGLAYFCGRGLRYLLLAWVAVLVQLTGWQIVAVQVGIVVLAIVGRVVWPLLARLVSGPREATVEEPAGP
ncbi:MAG: hypothetical protein ABIG44_03205 [Planctomycetota bacterium]